MEYGIKIMTIITLILLLIIIIKTFKIGIEKPKEHNQDNFKMLFEIIVSILIIYTIYDLNKKGVSEWQYTVAALITVVGVGATILQKSQDDKKQRIADKISKSRIEWLQTFREYVNEYIYLAEEEKMDVQCVTQKTN